MKMGTRKLHEKLKATTQEHNIHIGRDHLFTILRENDLLIKKRRRKIKTTDSKHWFKKYPNLIKGLKPSAPNQIWVSDITYWKCNEKHLYISFITDAYSHKIVGYHIANTLESVETIKALIMALENTDPDQFIDNRLIHHSDRGVQYCSKDYIDILRAYNIEISMTQSGDPLDNAIAERVNGIMKDEYLFLRHPENLEQAKNVLEECVRLYNNERPHNSIGNYTPDEIHFNPNINTKRLWKNYYIINKDKTDKLIKKVYEELQ